jgi:molecular chaperone IbpA
MRYDWTPLWRSTIGFDHLFDILDEVQRTSEETYPPYNIERTDDIHFRFRSLWRASPREVALTVEQNADLEAARPRRKKGSSHRGISARSFKPVHACRPRRGQARPLSRMAF